VAGRQVATGFRASTESFRRRMVRGSDLVVTAIWEGRQAPKGLIEYPETVDWLFVLAEAPRRPFAFVTMAWGGYRAGWPDNLQPSLGSPAHSLCATVPCQPSPAATR